MHYVIQQNLFNENGFAELIRIMDRMELSYDIVQMIPFTGQIVPEINPPQPCWVYGSIGLTRLAVRRKWSPGAYWNRRFDYRIWSKAWGRHCINAIGIVGRFGEILDLIPADWDEFFVRPCLDTKSFTGQVVRRNDFAHWQQRLTGLGSRWLNPKTFVVAAQPQTIYREYRFFVCYGRVVTGSLYKLGGNARTGLLIDREVIDFAQDRVNEWQPADCFVIDIGLTESGLGVIEMGCINGAGFYDADISLLLQAIESHWA